LICFAVYLGREVIDASIGVPVRFTSTQCISVRTAAQKAGLHVLHIVVGTLLTDRTMKATGQLGTVGQALNVGVSPSKLEISDIWTTGDMIRQRRTVRKHENECDDIQDCICDFDVPFLENTNETVDSFVDVDLCSVFEAAFESIQCRQSFNLS
jgi:hypothetical protein